MRCKLPGCEQDAALGKVWCSKAHEHAGRQCNFHGEPTGRNSVYRRLNRAQRQAFRRWLRDGGRLTP